MWHDQAPIKEAYGNPTGWHLDIPYWSFHSREAISVWIALEPATLKNDCMWFMPGSHRLARFDNAVISENLANLFDLYPEMTGVDPVAVPMQLGNCSFHKGLTAHAAGANITRGRRIAMTCSYMLAGSTFNGAHRARCHRTTLRRLPKAMCSLTMIGILLSGHVNNKECPPRLRKPVKQRKVKRHF